MMMMNKKRTTKAEVYKSELTSKILNRISPLEKKQVSEKMKLAARIEDLMKERNISKSELAQKLDKNASEVTKWLSGTQNFTIDVLVKIAVALGVELLNFFEKREAEVYYASQIEAIKSQLFIISAKAHYKTFYPLTEFTAEDTRSFKLIDKEMIKG